MVFTLKKTSSVEFHHILIEFKVEKTFEIDFTGEGHVGQRFRREIRMKSLDLSLVFLIRSDTNRAVTRHIWLET